ncbi:MAG: PKD domain-containing protein, partial [Candidatus Methylumidiphilus sp.]
MSPNAAAISVNVPAGVYFLKVDGVGKGDLVTGFSDYDSLGQYQLTGSYAASPYLPPVSVPDGTPLSGYAPLNVSFSSSGSSDPDGTVVSYLWNFGDGTSSTSPNPAHTYVSAGTYAAVLTVTDSQGLTSANSLTVYAAQDLFANTLHIG